MDFESVENALRTFFGPVNRVVRWFLWGGIALLGTAIALMVGLTLLPDTDTFPDPDAEALRGIRSVWMYAETNQSAERCGMHKGEIAAAVKGALGPSSFSVFETPGNTDAALVYRMHGASAANYCVLMVSWYLHGPVLSKKDRRDAYATLASRTTMVEYGAQDIARGKSLVLADIEKEMRDLSRRWSKVNPRQ